MWHKYKPCGDDVSHTISGSKGQVTELVGSFGLVGSVVRCLFDGFA